MLDGIAVVRVGLRRRGRRRRAADALDDQVEAIQTAA